MHDVLAARDGILLLLVKSRAADALGRGGGPSESWSLQVANLGPGHAFIASCRLGARGARPVEVHLPEPILAPGSTTPIFARRLFVDGRLDGAAAVGRPQPNPFEIAKPMLLESDIYVGDRQVRVTCVITVSSMSGDALVFEASSPAVVPSR